MTSKEQVNETLENLAQRQVEAAKAMGVTTIVTDYLENSPAKKIPACRHIPWPYPNSR